MKIIQAFGLKIRDRGGMPWCCGVGPLALFLIVGVLLVACSSGSLPLDQPANTPAASQVEAPATEASQAEAPPTEASPAEAPATEASPAEAPAITTSQAEALATQEGAAELPGTEEFGMTPEELVETIETVESLIAECMRDAGFEYIPVDYATVRQGMTADKSAPGLTTEEYAATYGYGISTQPPGGEASPAVIGLGEENRRIFNSLSPADQDAYNHTLFGENPEATFAVTLEAEDFSETGGCTRQAIEQVFSPEEMTVSYYNPGDALIEQDPRVIAAYKAWSDCMREAGFDYNNPEEPEPDLKERYKAILNGVEPENLSPPAKAALTELQGEERAIAVADLECASELVEPVVEQVEAELYGAPQQ